MFLDSGSLCMSNKQCLSNLCDRQHCSYNSAKIIILSSIGSLIFVSFIIFLVIRIIVKRRRRRIVNPVDDCVYFMKKSERYTELPL